MQRYRCYLFEATIPKRAVSEVIISIGQKKKNNEKYDKSTIVCRLFVYESNIWIMKIDYMSGVLKIYFHCSPGLFATSNAQSIKQQTKKTPQRIFVQ